MTPDATAVAVVTGGGSGIGRAIALSLAGDGHFVGVTDRNLAAAQHTVGLVEATGGSGRAFLVDVTVQSTIDDLHKELLRSNCSVRALVNNAGIDLLEGGVADMPRKAWDLTMAVNLTGPFAVSQAMVPLMPPGSSIVNISSVVALRAVPGADAYAASKGGLLALTKAMALSLAERGIRTNAVCPGIVGSDVVLAHLETPEIQAQLERIRPMGRAIGDPREVADVVAFLVSDHASLVNGVILPVDGGGVA